MDTLRTLEEHTSKLEAAINLNPDKLVIKYNQTPTKDNNSAYFDLCSAQNITLEPETTTLVLTGLKLEVPPGHNLLLFSHPKLAKEGYTVAAGDHRGEKLFIRNGTLRSKQIQNGEKLAYGLLIRAPEVEFVEENRDDVSEAQGVDQGYGSSGEK